MGTRTELTGRLGKQVQNKTEKGFSGISTAYSIQQFHVSVNIRMNELQFYFNLKKILFTIHVSRGEHMTNLTCMTYAFPGKGKAEKLDQQHY